MSGKIEKAEILEVERINGNVVVTFSDGRVTNLDPDDIHSASIEPLAKYPPDEVTRDAAQEASNSSRLRHTTAMELLQADLDRSVIALWLGHESVETTQIYLDANLALKGRCPQENVAGERLDQAIQTDDQLLSFLRDL